MVDSLLHKVVQSTDIGGLLNAYDWLAYPRSNFITRPEEERERGEGGCGQGCKLARISADVPS